MNKVQRDAGAREFHRMDCMSPRLRVSPRLVLLLVFLAVLAPCALAGSAPFDLTGPQIQINVTRDGVTLPIAKVPNLQAGDRVWMRPEMPDNEVVHYLLIPVFLRGSLNPPPASWFTKIEAWRKDVRREGITLTVPEGAQQMLLFWAPETGGGFTTVRSAVRARPGNFVRAAQDLYAADLTRSRLDAYIHAVRKIAAADPADLQRRANLLARTLYLKINQSCFDLPTEQQESCLTANTTNLVLNDSQSQSMVTALTSGSASDMINQLSSSTAAGGGVYSPYVGAVVDMVRIMGNLHTAQYAYIPAIAVLNDDTMSLKLNSPPSFINPKSVMIATLPPIAPVHFPELRAVHPQDDLCLQRPDLVLAVEGAPLVFSTNFAHSVTLVVHDSSGKFLRLPAHADAERGGFLVNAGGLESSGLLGTITGTISGDWGFDPWQGPQFRFVSSRPQQWQLASGESYSLTAGAPAALDLQAATACVASVRLQPAQGKPETLKWTAKGPSSLETAIPLGAEARGDYHLEIQQYGQTHPDTVTLHVYPPSATIAGLTMHAMDSDAELTGSRLEEVASVDMNGIVFHPAKVERDGALEHVLLSGPTSASQMQALSSGSAVAAQVHLSDGRVLQVPVKVDAPRPRVTLINKNVELKTTEHAAQIELGNPDDLPQFGRLLFFLRSDSPPQFPRDETIEVAAVNGGFSTTLSLHDATLTLEDAQTVLATLDPAKAFGPSAFGPLQFRPVGKGDVHGDWQPLANLVRLPSLNRVVCPADPVKPCTLEGDNLFLVDSVANNSAFSNPRSAPVGFAGGTMTVPRPNGTTLYLKLRDDTSAINRVSVPVFPESQN